MTWINKIQEVSLFYLKKHEQTPTVMQLVHNL